ncbi:hypothetical protein WG66_006190, partial [Moniliophthora roreri]
PYCAAAAIRLSSSPTSQFYFWLRAILASFHAGCRQVINIRPTRGSERRRND